MILLYHVKQTLLRDQGLLAILLKRFVRHVGPSEIKYVDWWCRFGIELCFQTQSSGKMSGGRNGSNILTGGTR
jgi:hypothetical protein